MHKVKPKHLRISIMAYMFICMLISTIFLLGNLQNIGVSTNNGCILPNTAIKSKAIERYFIDNIEKLNDSNDGEEIYEKEYQKDVRVVLKSLLNNRFSNEASNFRTVLKHYVIANEDNDGYNHPLSMYGAEDHNNALALFPLHRAVNNPNEDRIVKQLSLQLEITSEKLILVLFDNGDLITPALNSSHCPIKSCTFTRDYELIEKCDAVIFGHMSQHIDIPSNRFKQVWVYHSLESPANAPVIAEASINWTATYRSDSVLVTPYAKFVPFKNVSDLPDKVNVNYAAGKSKVAAIFVSNCDATNGRMKLVKELQKYVRIDVYGRCGKLKCDKNNHVDCHHMLRRDYKFYLAFENSNCRGYITEKFFKNALANNVVPIVMGAHPDDYKQLAPPHSYIHVDEFDSPRQLAEYMNILDNNDQLYNTYFRWKNTGYFVDTNFACRLCSMLQIANHFPMWYSDINAWWQRDACILPNREKREEWSKWKKRKKMIVDDFHDVIVSPF